MRRKTVTIGVSYLCGLFLASFLSVKTAAILLPTASAVTTAIALLMRSRTKQVLAVGVSFCVAVALSLAYTVLVYETQISYAGQEVTFCGKAVEAEHVSGDKMLYTLEGELGGTNAKISFFSDDRKLEYGDIVTVRATLSETEDNLYFRGRAYYKSQGIFLSGGYAEIINIKDGGFSFIGGVIKYRDYLTDKIMSFLPDDEGGLICAMLCGNTSFVSPEIKSVMSKAGLLHVFSVSGLHLVIIYYMIFWLCGMAGLRRKTKLLVCEMFILLFVLFAGGTVSVVRAAAMMTVHNLAPVFRRKYDCLGSVVLCVVIITVGNPYVIQSPSLLLSVAGALSLGWVSPMLLCRLDSKSRFYKLKESVAASATVSVITLPLNVIFFSEVSVISIVTNVFLLPLCSVALCVSAVVALTGGVAIIAKPLLMVAGLVIKVFLHFCRMLAALPFSSLPTGYIAVKYTTVVCFAVVLLLIIILRTPCIPVIIMSFSAFLCFIIVSLANRLLLSDTVIIYKLCDEDMQAVLVVQGSEATVINVSGSGAIAQVIPQLMQSKGVTQITKLYDLDGAPTVYSAYSEFLELENTEFVQSEGIAMLEMNGTTIAVAQTLVNNTGCNVMLCSDSILFENESVCYPLCDEIEEIMISDEKSVVRGLKYGFVE